MNKYIIFDLDGTILNTLRDLTNSVNFALKSFDFPERSIEEINGFVGNGIKKLVQLSVPDNTTEEITDKVYNVFNLHYSKHLNDFTKPYDGVKDLLLNLKNNGKKLAVVSNKPHLAVVELCDIHFKGYFEVVTGKQDKFKKKPSPDAVYYVMSEMNADKNCTVFIGDSEVDIKTAQNADIPCVSVSWGFRSAEQLKNAGANTIISDTVDLQRFLLSEK